VFVFKNGKEKHINNFELGQHGRYRTNVWDYPKVNSFANKESADEIKMHPTVKPVKLVADAILDCSHEGGAILDLFGGSGTTMVASEQLNRAAYLMELDSKYCQVIINRMRKLDPSVKITKNGIEI
jgi:DNA modification methylase